MPTPKVGFVWLSCLKAEWLNDIGETVAASSPQGKAAG